MTALINWTQKFWLISNFFIQLRVKACCKIRFLFRLSKVTSRSSVDDDDDNDSTDDEKTEDSKSMFLSFALNNVQVICSDLQ